MGRETGGNSLPDFTQTIRAESTVVQVRLLYGTTDDTVASSDAVAARDENWRKSSRLVPIFECCGEKQVEMRDW